MSVQFVEPILHKFGHNPDVDTATVPEDIWDGPTAIYPLPAAAAATTIRSSDAGDSFPAGTGMQSVQIEGIGADGKELIQIVNLNGITPVVLPIDLLRHNLSFGVLSGSGQANAGDITIQHATTVIGQISVARGRSLQTIYTCPGDIIDQRLLGYYASISRSGGVAIELVGLFLVPGTNTFQTFDIQGIQRDGGWLHYEFPSPGLFLTPGTDVKIQCTFTTANNTPVSAGFDIRRQHKIVS